MIRPRLVFLMGLALAASVSSTSSVEAQTAYIAFGDSITAGVGDDNRAEKGYPPRLEALLQGAGENAVVENYGIGGENTLEGLERIDSVLREAALSGDVLLLMQGTNDISNKISIETTRFNLNQMALRAESRGMNAIHATTIPRLPNAKFDPGNIANTELNQNIRDLAGRRGRDLADPFEVLSPIPDLFTRYYSQASDDPVGHPNAAGYDLLAQIFFNVIRKVDRIPPVTGLISPGHGDKEVPPSAQIVVDVWDFGDGIDLANTTLVINGVATGAVPAGNMKQATITYQAPTPLSGLVSVGLRSRDLASPSNTVDREVAHFTVAGTQVLTGDLDQDGRVDGADLLRFARRFGTRFGEALYSTTADFNGDGVIDGQDLAVLASNFGRSSS